MVNTLKIPFMCAEGVGRLRCVEIFLSTRPLQRARFLVSGTWDSCGAPCTSGSDKSTASNDSPMLWKPGSKCMASGSQCLRRRDLC